MKKITALFIAFSLALALTACGGPADVYARAVKKYRAATGVTLTYTDKTTFTKGSETSSATAEGTVSINQDEDVRSMSLKGSSAVDPGLGAKIDIPVEAYYTDGKYYATVSGNGVYYQADWKEMLRQTGQYFFAEYLTEADFEAIIAEDLEDGGTLITYVVPVSRAESLPGIGNIWSRYSEGEVSVNAFQGKLTLDDDGAPVKQELTVGAQITVDGDVTTVLKEIVTQINLYDDNVDVASPIGGKYREITG